MRQNLPLCAALTLVALAAGQVRAAPSCGEAAATRAPESTIAMGRQFFAQGVSLLDAKNFALAEKALQSALFTGLPAGQEQASAHKYLAYVYCLNGEAARCESEFDAALSALPTFSLGAYELNNTPWRAAYVQARNHWSQRCGRNLPDLPPMSESTTPAAAPTGAVPAPVPMAVESGRPALAHQENTLQFRVSPWALVLVDGKRVGVTPPVKQFNLSPGSHTVELSNPGFDSVRQTVQLGAGESVTITHDFDAR
ncbi:MAG: PEGA domain-containing protein [Curvibacter sp.]|nr:PEGA domain-containing protein [Curvibacter sp.]